MCSQCGKKKKSLRIFFSIQLGCIVWFFIFLPPHEEPFKKSHMRVYAISDPHSSQLINTREEHFASLT